MNCSFLNFPKFVCSESNVEEKPRRKRRKLGQEKYKIDKLNNIIKEKKTHCETIHKAQFALDGISSFQNNGAPYKILKRRFKQLTNVTTYVTVTIVTR